GVSKNATQRRLHHPPPQPKTASTRRRLLLRDVSRKTSDSRIGARQRIRRRPQCFHRDLLPHHASGILGASYFAFGRSVSLLSRRSGRDAAVAPRRLGGHSRSWDRSTRWNAA